MHHRQLFPSQAPAPFYGSQSLTYFFYLTVTHLLLSMCHNHKPLFLSHSHTLFFWVTVPNLFLCVTVTHLFLSVKHLARALHRLGSGHRSSGVWPFLFLRFRSAPLAAKKQAMEALEDFFSAPCRLRPS